MVFHCQSHWNVWRSIDHMDDRKMDYSHLIHLHNYSAVFILHSIEKHDSHRKYMHCIFVCTVRIYTCDSFSWLSSFFPNFCKQSCLHHFLWLYHQFIFYIITPRNHKGQRRRHFRSHRGFENHRNPELSSNINLGLWDYRFSLNTQWVWHLSLISISFFSENSHRRNNFIPSVNIYSLHFSRSI